MTNNTIRILVHIDSGKNPNDSTPFFLVRVELVTPNGSYPISDHGPYGTEAFAVEAAQTIMKNTEANAPAIFAKLGLPVNKVTVLPPVTHGGGDA